MRSTTLSSAFVRVPASIDERSHRTDSGISAMLAVNPPCISGQSQRLQRAYNAARAKAFDMFKSNGENKEVSFTLFQNNTTGGIDGYFQVGRDSGSSFYATRAGSTLLLVGHIHNRPAGEFSFALRIPPWVYAAPGPSPADKIARADLPSPVFVLQEKADGA